MIYRIIAIIIAVLLSTVSIVDNIMLRQEIQTIKQLQLRELLIVEKMSYQSMKFEKVTTEWITDHQSKLIDNREQILLANNSN